MGFYSRGNIYTGSPMGTFTHSLPCELLHRVSHGIIYTESPMGTFTQSLPWELLHRDTHGNFYTKSPMGTFTQSLPWELLHRVSHGNIYIETPMGTFKHCLLNKILTSSVFAFTNFITWMSGTPCILMVMFTPNSRTPLSVSKASKNKLKIENIKYVIRKK